MQSSRNLPLSNRLQPAQELDVQTIMEIFHCEYDGVIEALDLYNMDVDESQVGVTSEVHYEPENYFLSTEPNEEICVVDEYQKRGTSFPVAVRTNGHFEHCFALMDTGASRSCISYRMFLKIKKPKWSSKPVPRVCTADGSDLGSLGRIDLTAKIGRRREVV